MKLETKSIQKIHTHVKKTVYHLRGKPYETRMHIIRIFTVVASGFVVLLWVFLLKKQFKIDPIQKEREVTTQGILSEGIFRVYNQSKDIISNNETQ